jgi:hypothetical protein
MPIYEDVVALSNSLLRIAQIDNLRALYSSWGEPLYGQAAVNAVHAGMRYLMTLHRTVMQVFSEPTTSDPMELCKQCVGRLGLPPFAANPLVLRSFLAHQRAEEHVCLNALFSPFLRL